MNCRWRRPDYLTPIGSWIRTAIRFCTTPRFPNDSYFLQTQATDKQYALFGEGTYSFTDQYKLTVGARYS